ncbi:hypothetical protein D1BOALGB6SA_4326 [Olavius sp. associated proteobacterium Delta 1]|nr:hypothetical protein D1BOALGB6SA_4326 [Olavius sp. associated proteobacterium Delta 1]
MHSVFILRLRIEFQSGLNSLNLQSSIFNIHSFGSTREIIAYLQSKRKH